MYSYKEGLESERLVTGFLNESHMPLWERFFTDNDAMRYFPGLEANTPSQNAKSWIERQMNRYAQNQYGLQALYQKETGAFIGQCGLITQTVDDTDELEVGYHIFSEFRGQGFAPEAARLFLSFGFGQSHRESIISMIKRNNLPSQRVADKNGLLRESETIWKDLDIFIYRIQKADWMASGRHLNLV